VLDGKALQYLQPRYTTASHPYPAHDLDPVDDVAAGRLARVERLPLSVRRGLQLRDPLRRDLAVELVQPPVVASLARAQAQRVLVRALLGPLAVKHLLGRVLPEALQPARGQAGVAVRQAPEPPEGRPLEGPSA